MVLFEGKTFNEKRVMFITTGENSLWSHSIKNRYYIKMQFDNSDSITWERYLPETAISKLNELTRLINQREEALLKLRTAS